MMGCMAAAFEWADSYDSKVRLEAFPAPEPFALLRL